jgi:hypothetical protein
MFSERCFDESRSADQRTDRIWQRSEIRGEVRNKLQSQMTGKNRVDLVLLPISEMLKTVLRTNDGQHESRVRGA